MVLRSLQLAPDGPVVISEFEISDVAWGSHDLLARNVQNGRIRAFDIIVVMRVVIGPGVVERLGHVDKRPIRSA